MIVRCDLRCAHQIAVTLLILLASGSTGAFGQSERYELGKRLRRVESAWELADSAQRARAVSPMEEAVRSFFSLQLRTAGKSLDRAYFLIRGLKEPSELHEFAISRQVKVEPLLADIDSSGLTIQITPFYEVKAAAPSDAKLQLQFLKADHSIADSISIDFPQGGTKFSWPLKPDLAGDFVVTAKLIRGKEEFSLLETQISRVKDFSGRLQSLERALQSPPAGLSPTALATVRDWCALIERLQKGETLEVDYPAEKLLSLAERIFADPDKSAQVLAGAARETGVWLTLSNGKREIPVRIRAPQKQEDELPLLFLFHGAGGSENMFFETYGAGRAVSLGVKRDWLVVAPRQGLLGLGMNAEEMLGALSELFPLDRKRVAVLGHSMGAGQVMRQVAQKPELFRVAVALGGGGRLSQPEKVTSIAWYVGAGEKDFGRGGARSLAQSLENAGAPVTYKEFPQVEHMMIVQAALDEVFQFIDKNLASAALQP